MHEIIRNLRRIRPMLDLKTVSTIAISIVHVKIRLLQFCLPEHIGHPDKAPRTYSECSRRVVTKTLKHHHITHVLKILQLLKILERKEYIYSNITYIIAHFNPPSPPASVNF